MENLRPAETAYRHTISRLGRAAINDGNAYMTAFLVGTEVAPVALDKTPLVSPDLGGGLFLAAVAINTARQFLKARA